MRNGSPVPVNKFLQPAFLWASLALLVVLLLRSTRGIDLTDEMQYYGQIRGLLESGQLFSSDLFIQQSVYIFLYPLFKMYHSVFGLEGLVLFGRLIMSVISFGIFTYVYKKFLDFDFPVTVAVLTSASLCFAIPYHGIYAPSYNTISQATWIIFAINFYGWQQSRPVLLSCLLVITLLAHPSSALAMSALILVRLLYERDIKKLRTVLFFGTLLTLALLAVALYLADPQSYIDSLSFSSGYGVGSYFFKSLVHPIGLLGVITLFLIAALDVRMIRGVNYTFLLPVSLVCTLFALLFDVSGGGYGYTPWTVLVLAIPTALAYGWIVSTSAGCEGSPASQCHWLTALLLVFTATLAITSGNGFAQATGAFMVGLPLYVGIAAASAISARQTGSLSRFHTVSAILVLLLLNVHWLKYPYREDNMAYTNTVFETVPAYEFIHSSSQRVDFIVRMQEILRPLVEGKKTLIISEYPALYLALPVSPESCMLYMHSVTSDKSERVLLDCLNRRAPEVIVDILSDRNTARPSSRIKNLLYSYILAKGYKCDGVITRLVSRPNTVETLKITICE